MPPEDSSNDSIKRLLPWLVAIAVFMEALDTTILNTAVPAIAEALNVPPLSMKAVLSSYTLSLAVFIPVSGWMADRYGTRRVFSSAIAIFTVGSVLCGISNSIHMLVFCRILQGCGGAMMVPVGRLTMVRTFAKSELIRAMSFVAVPALIGPMLGPVAGGLIVGFLHWRMIFFINLPIGLLGLYFIYRHLPDYRERIDQLDITGLILFGAGVALLSYVLEVFGEHTLGGREVLGLLGLSIVLLLGYGRHAAATPHPLLRLGLFRIRTFRAAVVGGFITRLGVGGMPFLLPLLYQVGLGYTPVQSGFLIMPQALAAMSLKMSMPLVLTRFGYRRVLIYNTVIIGVILVLFATIGPGTPVWFIVLQAAIHEYEHARVRRRH
jgi:EmrB/QacA subfamily drug resistance transporter